jgi:hypothetical protein
MSTRFCFLLLVFLSISSSNKVIAQDSPHNPQTNKTVFIIKSSDQLTTQEYCLPENQKLVKVLTTSQTLDGAVAPSNINVEGDIAKNCIVVRASLPVQKYCYNSPQSQGLSVLWQPKCDVVAPGFIRLEVTYEFKQ